MSISKISYKFTGRHINGSLYYDDNLGTIVLRTTNEVEDVPFVQDRIISIHNSVDNYCFMDAKIYNQHLTIKNDLCLTAKDLKGMIGELQEVLDALDSLETASELIK